jgi:hypothetical protein
MHTFVDINLPNPTTWFYFSLLLAVALFLKYTRFLSVRNLDVVTLFLLVPGLLLVRERGVEWWGYLWLLAGSAFFFARCLFDLALVQRPALSPNLNLGGLATMAGVLFISLVVVAVNPPGNKPPLDSKAPPLTEIVSESAQKVVEQQTPAGNLPDSDVRIWTGRGLAILAHMTIIAGLIVIGWRHFGDIHSGVAAATFYLLLPYTAVAFGQWYHVLPMALVVWAVFFYKRPALAGMLLGIAAGSVYVPLLIAPIWWSFYRGRGTGRFTLAFCLSLGLCVAVTCFISQLREIQTLRSLQPWLDPSPDTKGFWTGIDWAWAYRMPVFVLYMAFVLLTAFWPSPKNLAHVLALSAAVLIGVQFWYADQGGAYVLWYLPLLLLLVFRPNLADRRPLLINPETDWLFRVGRWLVRVGSRLIPRPEIPVQQH